MFEFNKGILYPKDHKSFKRLNEYKEYYKVKYSLCKQYNPKVIAEIGVRAGYSAWSFMQACPDALYIGIDANNGTHGGQGGESGCYFKWAEHLLQPYNYKLVEMDTQKVNSLDLKDVDFFHVDGDHTSLGVQHDLDLALKVLSKDGVILVDDITYLDTVNDGVKIWLNNNEDVVDSKFVPSLRGEMLIYKKKIWNG